MKTRAAVAWEAGKPLSIEEVDLQNQRFWSIPVEEYSDQILLFCYHYDPATGKYGAAALNLMRFAGITFVRWQQ